MATFIVHDFDGDFSETVYAATAYDAVLKYVRDNYCDITADEIKSFGVTGVTDLKEVTVKGIMQPKWAIITNK